MENEMKWQTSHVKWLETAKERKQQMSHIKQGEVENKVVANELCSSKREEVANELQ